MFIATTTRKTDGMRLLLMAFLILFPLRRVPMGASQFAHKDTPVCFCERISRSRHFGTRTISELSVSSLAPRLTPWLGGSADITFTSHCISLSQWRDSDPQRVSPCSAFAFLNSRPFPISQNVVLYYIHQRHEKVNATYLLACGAGIFSKMNQVQTPQRTRNWRLMFPSLLLSASLSGHE